MTWVQINVDDFATLAVGYKGNWEKDKLVIAAAAVAGVTVLDAICADRLTRATKHQLPHVGNYRSRSGYPQGIRQSRGVATHVEGSEGLLTPASLKPWAA